jgi:hypothetical protein
VAASNRAREALQDAHASVRALGDDDAAVPLAAALAEAYDHIRGAV